MLGRINDAAPAADQEPSRRSQTMSNRRLLYTTLSRDSRIKLSRCAHEGDCATRLPRILVGEPRRATVGAAFAVSIRECIAFDRTVGWLKACRNLRDVRKMVEMWIARSKKFGLRVEATGSMRSAKR